jgi:hypothetical protein
MKVSVPFSDLNSALGYINPVLADKSVKPENKNVIFIVTADEVKIAAYNAFTMCRTVLNNAEVEDVFDMWQFQVKATDVNKIISAFSNLSKTKAEFIDFENEDVHIKVTVHERALKEEDSCLSQDSSFELQSSAIARKINEELLADFPESPVLYASGDLLLYLDPMVPMLTDDTSNGIASRLNFAHDYVFVTSPSWSAFMQNKLSEEFHNLCLGYSSVVFFKKLCEGSENISIARTPTYLCIEVGNTQAFMRYKPVKVTYSAFVSKRSTERGIVLDRPYFRDVLRRMGAVDTDGKLSIISDSALLVENSSFQQEIPLIKSKGADIVGTRFNASISTLSNLLLGRDEVFSSTVFIYFVNTTRGYMLFLSDSTGAWFTTAQVSSIK